MRRPSLFPPGDSRRHSAITGHFKVLLATLIPFTPGPSGRCRLLAKHSCFSTSPSAFTINLTFYPLSPISANCFSAKPHKTHDPGQLRIEASSGASPLQIQTSHTIQGDRSTSPKHKRSPGFHKPILCIIPTNPISSDAAQS